MDANQHEWLPGEREAIEANPPAWHEDVLRKRAAEYRANPSLCIPWETAKVRIRELAAKERKGRKG